MDFTNDNNKYFKEHYNSGSCYKAKRERKKGCPPSKCEVNNGRSFPSYFQFTLPNSMSE